MSGTLIYLVAGEASGDMLGAGFIKSLRQQKSDVCYTGIGGELMQKEGLQSLFPYSDLSIMGFIEVVPHIPLLLKRLKQTVQNIADKQPAAVITIDSPGFNFRLARLLKDNPKTTHIKRIHYVAPSVWAYKPKRAHKTALLFDLLLTLLPFEPPYFEKEGLKTVFVGHPVLWENQKGNGTAFRTRHDIPADEPILLILPGSRMGEVKRLLPIFSQATKALLDHKVVILASPQVKAFIHNHVKPSTLVVDIDEKRDAFAAANIALSKSGTVTLELAVAGVPMVVAHKVSALSAWLIRRMAYIPFVSLVNIALKKEVVPELLQERCNPLTIMETLYDLANTESMEQQRRNVNLALEALRGNNTANPNDVAAEAVLSCLHSEKH